MVYHNPLRRCGGTSPKGEGAEALENGANTFHTTPQSFCSFGAKIQLPLHRGAEVRSPSAGCGACTGEPRNAPETPRCKLCTRGKGLLRVSALRLRRPRQKSLCQKKCCRIINILNLLLMLRQKLLFCFCLCYNYAAKTIKTRQNGFVNSQKGVFVK